MYHLFDHIDMNAILFISKMLELIELLLLFGFFSLFKNMIFLSNNLSKIELVCNFVMIIRLLGFGGIRCKEVSCMLTNIILDLRDMLISHHKVSQLGHTSMNMHMVQ
jgi:hypothetical protein